MPRSRSRSSGRSRRSDRDRDSRRSRSRSPRSSRSSRSKRDDSPNYDDYRGPLKASDVRSYNRDRERERGRDRSPPPKFYRGQDSYRSRGPLTEEELLRRVQERDEASDRGVWARSPSPSPVRSSKSSKSKSKPSKPSKSSSKSKNASRKKRRDDSDSDSDSDSSSSSSDSGSSSDSSDSESDDDRRRKSKKSSSKSSKKKAKAVSPSSSSAESDSEEETKEAQKDEEKQIVPVESKEPARKVIAAEAGDMWEAPTKMPVELDEYVGPRPAAKEAALDVRSYGGALLPGEGAAIAGFVQAGQRIPRRGEIGLTSEEIENYETLGFVMSGSRHKRMNAIRIRKENQVYSAEEMRALSQLNFEEKEAKEKKLMSDFRKLIQEKVGENA